MKIDKAGIPFIAAALVPAAVLAGARRYGWAAGVAALGGFFAYFFRDPERTVPQRPGLVVAPAEVRIADGRVPARPRRDPGARRRARRGRRDGAGTSARFPRRGVRCLIRSDGARAIVRGARGGASSCCRR